jgi:biopolymer transport protein ExbB
LAASVAAALSRFYSGQIQMKSIASFSRFISARVLLLAMLSAMLLPLNAGAEPVAAAATPVEQASAGSQPTLPAAPAPEAGQDVLADAESDADTAADTAAGNSLLAHDLSPWGMYLGADIVVKSVMIGLALASILTWTIWVAKGLELLRAKRRSSRPPTRRAPSTVSAAY